MKKFFIIILSIFIIIQTTFADFSQKQEFTLKQKFTNAIESLNFEQIDVIYSRIENFEKGEISENLYDILQELKQIAKETAQKKLVVSHFDFPFNIENLKEVSAWSKNIFIAKVISNGKPIYKAGKYAEDEFIKTEFDVDILYNIKGNFKGNKVLTFDGGYDKSGILYIPEGQMIPKKGNTYLFVTSGSNNYIHSYKNGLRFLKFEKIFGFNSKDYTENLKETITNNEIIEEYRNAYKNEVELKGKNRYKDLTEQEKKDFENFDNGFVN